MKTEYYIFDPKQDITAYELAQIMTILDSEKEIPPELLRHFKKEKYKQKEGRTKNINVFRK